MGTENEILGLAGISLVLTTVGFYFMCFRHKLHALNMIIKKLENDSFSESNNQEEGKNGR